MLMRSHFIPIRPSKAKGLKISNVVDKAGDKSIESFRKMVWFR